MEGGGGGADHVKRGGIRRSYFLSHLCIAMQAPAWRYLVARPAVTGDWGTTTAAATGVIGAHPRPRHQLCNGRS